MKSAAQTIFMIMLLTKNLNIFLQNVDRTFGESVIFFKTVIRKVSKIMKKSDQKRNSVIKNSSDVFANLIHEFFSVLAIEKENKFLISPKHFIFFSVCQLKKKL